MQSKSFTEKTEIFELKLGSSKIWHNGDDVAEKADPHDSNPRYP